MKKVILILTINVVTSIICFSGIHLRRDTLLPQLLAAMACRRCLGMGNSSICDNTLSNRSGNDRLKNRDAGVVPFAAQQSKLCSTVHT